jgi:DNA-directed RNA polymerase specialized sigma24 family protein
MSSEESVSNWLGQLQAGDPAAAQQLWQRYFQRLVDLARSKLRGRHRRAADEADVALSAFDSFCQGAARGRFTQPCDRDNLRALLLVLTEGKARRLAQHEGWQKRGGLDQEPCPAFAAKVARECRRLLSALGDAELEAVAVWKRGGYRNDLIAAKLGCAPRTVERKLRLIRSISEKETAP